MHAGEFLNTKRKHEVTVDINIYLMNQPKHYITDLYAWL